MTSGCKKRSVVDAIKISEDDMKAATIPVLAIHHSLVELVIGNLIFGA